MKFTPLSFVKFGTIYTCLTILSTLIFFNAFSQDVTISGVVKENQTNQPVGYGTVILKASSKGTKTDNEGKFNLKIPKTKIGAVLIISSLGYQSQSVYLEKDKSNYQIFLEPSNNYLNQVVVTGVARATLAKENPIPVVAVTTLKLEQATESNVIDVLVKNVPGLNAVKTGPNISKPFIRGLGYNRVLTLYDGIRQEGQQWGDEHGIEVGPYNVERAEVVKGPSSLIYGSDALAGVVGLIPFGPRNTDGKIIGKFTTEYQGNNEMIGNGIHAIYGNKHWSYALSGAYRLAKDYENSIDRKVYNTGFKEANATAGVKYTNDKGASSIHITLYDNYQGIPDGSRDSLSRAFTYQTKEGSEDNIFDRPVVPQNVLNAYQQSPLNQHIQHYRIYTKNHYQLGKGDFDILLAFQQNIRREYTHPTIPDQAGMYVRLNTLNYGLDYHVPIFKEIELSAGFNGMYQGNISKNATDFPIPNYTLLDAGIYSYAKWKHRKWTVGSGIRYDQRHLKGADFYTKPDLMGFVRQVKDGHINGAYLQFPSFEKTFHGVSLSVGSTYALNDYVSLKANIARGYRAPSIPEFSSNGLDPGAHITYLGNRSFKPEFSLQEDLGIEASTNNFTATFSVFNNNISDYIFLTQLVDASGNPVVDAQKNKTYQYQQSKAQLYGAEATFGLHPAAWKGFEFDHSFSITYGFNRGDKLTDKGLQGAYLPLIPPLHYLGSISQTFDLKSTIFSSINIKGVVDFNGAQPRYLALNKTETFTPSYTLIDFGIVTSIKYSDDRKIHLQFQVNNILDKAYQSNLNRLKYFDYYAASPNGHLGIYNMGRNVSVKAIIPF
ncbi:iron complex outermembrane receptor protein [Pedobacter sp. UYEF25]